MGSHEVSKEAVVSAPADRVWKAMVDPKEARAWLPHAQRVEMVDGSKPAKGAKRRVELDADGRRVESIQEITEFEQNARFGWRHLEDRVDGKPFDWLAEAGLHFTLEPEGKKTRVTVVARWRTKGLKAKLAGMAIRKVVTDQAEEALANLKKHLEA